MHHACLDALFLVWQMIIKNVSLLVFLKGLRSFKTFHIKSVLTIEKLLFYAILQLEAFLRRIKTNNCDFLSFNSDFISRSSEFLSHNFE